MSSLRAPRTGAEDPRDLSRRRFLTAAGLGAGLAVLGAASARPAVAATLARGTLAGARPTAQLATAAATGWPVQPKAPGTPLAVTPIGFTGDEPALGAQMGTCRAGWTVYDTQAMLPAVLQQLKAMKPTVVRWQVSWDLYERGTNPWNAAQWPGRCNWASHDAFFQTCAQLGVLVMSQLVVKDTLWGALWWMDPCGVFPGARWAKPGDTANYPYNVDATYGVFVRNLVDRMLYNGIKPQNIVSEAWNEPDLDWGAGSTGILDTPSPWSLQWGGSSNSWSGGYGAAVGQPWGDLHRTLNQSKYGGNTWGTSGIGGRRDLCHTKNVPTGCARISPWITSEVSLGSSVIDLHLYFNNRNLKGVLGTKYPVGAAEYIVAEVREVLQVWDYVAAQQGRAPLPFIWGEAGPDSGGPTTTGAPPSSLEARELRRAHLQLAAEYPTRFLGTVELGGSWWDSSSPTGIKTGWWNPSYRLNNGT